jgi:hypothetical protein
MNDLRRVVAVLLQVVIPGCIGAFLAFVMAGVMSSMKGNPGAILPFVVFAGPVVGFLTWLFGLIADRASGERLLLTVLCATLGFLVSFLVLFFFLAMATASPDVAQSLALAIAATVGGILALAAPVAGALAGYHWVGKQRPNPP